MLFNGVFNDMTPSQCVALCSCFVVTENVKEEQPKLSQELAGPFKIMQVSSMSFFLIYCHISFAFFYFILRIRPNELQQCQKNAN